MTNGIITIAVGGTTYGKLALNLAISIRNKSSIPLAVIYTPSAFDGIEHALKLFEHKIEIKNTGNPIRTVMGLKVNIDKYSPFDTTIFLDADCIICPTHKADEWFNRLSGVEFTAYNTDIYQLDGQPNEAYKAWAEPSDILKALPLKNDDKIPQINSSFLYWVKSPKIDRLFEAARSAMRSGVKHEKFRGEFPDELAFNIACAVTKIYPHKKKYKPVFLHIQSEIIRKEYIIENFTAMSAIGGGEIDGRVVEYYNDFADYYNEMGGYVERHKYMPKKQDNSQRPIYGFYHVCMINNYKQIVKEQVDEIVKSGLYNAAEKIYVTLAGDRRNEIEAIKLFGKYNKFEFSTASIRGFEFPTIHAIKKRADKGNKEFYFYIHTKGVTYPNHAGGKYWRDYMMYYNVGQFKKCVERLKEGYETCGVKLVENHSAFPKHYSGNFWWARSEYIQRCPEVEKLDWSDRYQAEFWICKSNPTSATLCQVYIDYNQNPKYK